MRESVCIFVVDLSGGFWDVFGRLFFIFWFGNVRELVFVRVDVFLKRDWGRRRRRREMAVAAFKATTRSRRTCNIRGVEVEVPSTPHSRNTSPVRRSRPSSSPVKRMPSSSSTPRSRPASPTKQQQFAKQNDRMHRRTRSFVDLSSSRYFTDSSSLAAAENPGGCRSSSGLRSSAHHLASGSEVSFSPSVSIILSVYPNILGKCVSIIMQQSCHC